MQARRCRQVPGSPTLEPSQAVHPPLPCPTTSPAPAGWGHGTGEVVSRTPIPSTAPRCHVRGQALQLAIQPPVLCFWHQHRDNIPGVEAQQGAVGPRRVGHDGLHPHRPALPPALAAAAGLAEGTGAGDAAGREQTCGEASERSGWSSASSCKTHVTSRGPVRCPLWPNISGTSAACCNDGQTAPFLALLQQLRVCDIFLSPIPFFF